MFRTLAISPCREQGAGRQKWNCELSQSSSRSLWAEPCTLSILSRHFSMYLMRPPRQLLAKNKADPSARGVPPGCTWVLRGNKMVARLAPPPRRTALLRQQSSPRQGQHHTAMSLQILSLTWGPNFVQDNLIFNVSLNYINKGDGIQSHFQHLILVMSYPDPINCFPNSETFLTSRRMKSGENQTHVKETENSASLALPQGSTDCCCSRSLYMLQFLQQQCWQSCTKTARLIQSGCDESM